MSLEGGELIMTGVGIVASTVGITKLMLNAAVRSIKHHCAMQRDSCMEWRKGSEKDRDSLHCQLHSHGHKGLNENGSKVTL